jgi:nucleoside diphosphate kinase
VQRGLVGEVIKRFEQKGFKLVALKLIAPTKEQAEGHYAEHKGKGFFAGLVGFFSSGPLVAMVWEVTRRWAFFSFLDRSNSAAHVFSAYLLPVVLSHRVRV